MARGDGEELGEVGNGVLAGWVLLDLDRMGLLAGGESGCWVSSASGSLLGLRMAASCRRRGAPAKRGRQLIARLTAGIRELCESQGGITVHHFMRLTDLNR